MTETRTAAPAMIQARDRLIVALDVDSAAEARRVIAELRDMQTYVVAFVIVFALAFAGVTVWRKVRSFSTKRGCEADCGCGEKSKTLSSKPV